MGKTLHAKDGKVGPPYEYAHFYIHEIFQLGFFNSSKGFVYATNFIVDIQSQVHSEKYVIKGISSMGF